MRMQVLVRNITVVGADGPANWLLSMDDVVVVLLLNSQ